MLLYVWMTSIIKTLNIAATNPTHGMSFNYHWVGHKNIQKQALA
jgi:hypothetical protein